MKRVKAETGLPVTYADVWEFWLRHPELADDVDFVTIHILPYWEDDPVPAGDGVTHIDAILRMVEAEMPGKTIYIGETGYPSAGKQRERALPGLVEQASFIRGFLAYAHERGLDYNVIEAFDQPWKRALEGTVGGYWGVFSEGRASKFPLTGPVARMGSPWPWLAGTIALGIVLWWPARRAAGTPIAALAGPLLAGAAALAVVLQVDHAQFAAWYWHERAIEGAPGADLDPGCDAGSAAHPRGQQRRDRLALARVSHGCGAHGRRCRMPRWRSAFCSCSPLRARRWWPSASTSISAIATIRSGALPCRRWPLRCSQLRASGTAAARQMPIELCFATLLALSAVFIALNENVFTRPEMRQSIAAAFGPALRGDISGNSLIWCLLLLAFAYPWFALRRGVASEQPAIGSRSIRN